MGLLLSAVPLGRDPLELLHRAGGKLRVERAGAAEAALEEAREIHATPEVTEQLRHGIQEGESALARQQSEVDSLADTERRLRESTRSKRFLLIGVAVAIVVIVVLLVVLLTRGA